MTWNWKGLNILENKLSWSPSDTPADVVSKAAQVEPVEKVESVGDGAPLVTHQDKTAVCPVPGCSAQVSKVERHIYDRARAGDDAHILWRVDHPKKTGRPVGSGAPVEAVVPGLAEPVFDVETGRLSVLIILGLLIKKVPTVTVPSSPGDLSPGSVWVDRAAKVHQKLLEKYLGERVRENGELIQLMAVWVQLAIVNGFMSYGFGANGIDNRAKGEGEDEPGKVPDA